MSFSQTEVVLLHKISASSLLWSSSPFPHLSSSAITCCSGSFGYASNPTSSLFLYFYGFWKSWIIDMQTNVNILYASLVFIWIFGFGFDWEVFRLISSVNGDYRFLTVIADEWEIHPCTSRLQISMVNKCWSEFVEWMFLLNQ